MDFADLYTRYADSVFRFAYYLCGNRALAEDIAAETFARALTVRDRIEPGSVKAYLLSPRLLDCCDCQLLGIFSEHSRDACDLNDVDTLAWRPLSERQGSPIQQIEHRCSLLVHDLAACGNLSILRGIAILLDDLPQLRQRDLVVWLEPDVCRRSLKRHLD